MFVKARSLRCLGATALERQRHSSRSWGLSGIVQVLYSLRERSLLAGLLIKLRAQASHSVLRKEVSFLASLSRKICCCRPCSNQVAFLSIAFLICFQISRNGSAPAKAQNFRGASSRCSRLGAYSEREPGCYCSMSPQRGLLQ